MAGTTTNEDSEKQNVPLALAPVLDFCNHSALSNAQHAVGADGGLVLTATADVKEGEEVCIDYGEGRDSLSFMVSIYE